MAIKQEDKQVFKLGLGKVIQMPKNSNIITQGVCMKKEESQKYYLWHALDGNSCFLASSDKW